MPTVEMKHCPQKQTSLTDVGFDATYMHCIAYDTGNNECGYLGAKGTSECKDVSRTK